MSPRLASLIGPPADKDAVKNLHVSLVRLADCEIVPPSYVDLARSALDVFHHEKFEITLDRVMRFKPVEAAVLAGAPGAVAGFRRRLLDRLKAGRLVRSAPASFTPHMTLRYSVPPFEPYPVAPVQWRANEFCMIASRQGLGRHDVLARWELDG